MITLGAQFYTVRSLLNSEEQIRKTISTIKEIGYDFIQLFGSPEQIDCYAGLCHQCGIPVNGILTGMKTCEEQGTELFKVCKKHNIKDIGISAFCTEYNEALDFIDKMNLLAEKTTKQEFTLSYHNHGREFIKVHQNKTIMELYIDGFDSERITFMPDTYWIHDGGFDVRYFLELTHGRVSLLHLKDLKKTKDGHTFAEIGSGNLYFKGILKTALDCGITQFAVEQDECDGNPLDSLKQSYLVTKKLLEELQ